MIWVLLCKEQHLIDDYSTPAAPNHYYRHAPARPPADTVQDYPMVIRFPFLTPSGSLISTRSADRGFAAI